MSNYKSVRLEESVYQWLTTRMKPQESISKTLERLLRERVKFEEVIENLNQILYGGK